MKILCCLLLALPAIAACRDEEPIADSEAVARAGDLSCGESVAIEPLDIDNCAWCSFDDYATGRALLPPNHVPVFGALDIRGLIGADCAPLDPAQAELVAALRAAIDDALAVARQRVQGCYTCPGTWDIPVDECGIPTATMTQAGNGCGVEVTGYFAATCACEEDPFAPGEVCGDGRDNDGDGLFECEDPGCVNLDGTCDAHESACADGEDNDRDGNNDCADPDCASADGCRYEPIENCVDTVDNDDDGLVDCDDADCAGTFACAAQEQCANGLDDDGDGTADCADGECSGVGMCISDVEQCRDGDDDDGDGQTDCADAECALSPLCVVTGPIEACASGVDGDGDGVAGCADPDCGSHPACWTSCGDGPSCWF